MGQQPSKDQLLYQYASSGNVDKINARRAQGAELKVLHPYFPFNSRASVVLASRPSPPEDVELAMAINAELEATHPYFPFNTRASVVPASRPSPAEDVELAMAINASIQSAMESRPPYVDAIPASRPSPAEDVELAMAINASIQSAMESRPPYVDANPISGASTSSSCQSGRVRNHNKVQEVVDGRASSLCVICLVAPVEGACIPCGHMVGCMSCLSEIKGKEWSCPVCRTKITQVIRIYTV